MSKFEANTARQAIDSIPPSLLRDDGRGKALTTGGTYWMPSFQSVLPKDRGRGGHVGRGDHHRETRVPRATPSQLQEARHLRGLVGDVDALERSLGRVERHASEMMQDLHTARSVYGALAQEIQMELAQLGGGRGGSSGSGGGGGRGDGRGRGMDGGARGMDRAATAAAAGAGGMGGRREDLEDFGIWR